ncbi:uncharacterized protein LOC135166146 [Diachasmimorpha longicaudata]|uniref:uncharacterized protein LOC135166146 n=1 Tax=Diachasmimorpha longicaudata TaxID=58733 RepID=UPI0030B89078
MSNKGKKLANQKSSFASSTPLGSTQADHHVDGSISSIELVDSGKTSKKRTSPGITRHVSSSRKKIPKNQKLLGTDFSDEMARSEDSGDPQIGKPQLIRRRKTGKRMKSVHQVHQEKKQKVKGSRKELPVREPEVIREAGQPIPDVHYVDKDRLFFRPPDHEKDTHPVDEDDIRQVLHHDVLDKGKENDPGVGTSVSKSWRPRSKPPHQKNRSHLLQTLKSDVIRKIVGEIKTTPCPPIERSPGGQTGSTGLEGDYPEVAAEGELPAAVEPFVGRKIPGEDVDLGAKIFVRTIRSVSEDVAGGEEDKQEADFTQEHSEDEEMSSMDMERASLEKQQEWMQKIQQEICAEHKEHRGILDISLINRWPVRKRTSAEKYRIKQIVGCAPIVRNIGWLTYHKFAAYSSPSGSSMTDGESPWESSPGSRRTTKSIASEGRSHPKKRKDSEDSSIVRSKRRKVARILESSDDSEGTGSGSIFNRM